MAWRYIFVRITNVNYVLPIEYTSKKLRTAEYVLDLILDYNPYTLLGLRVTDGHHVVVGAQKRYREGNYYTEDVYIGIGVKVNSHHFLVNTDVIERFTRLFGKQSIRMTNDNILELHEGDNSHEQIVMWNYNIITEMEDSIEDGDCQFR